MDIVGEVIDFTPRKFNNIDRCINTHRNAFEEWTDGEPVETWTDENGILCIKYKSGKWWHYREKKGSIEWW